MNRLIDSMLDIAAIESGNLQLELKLQPLEDLIVESVAFHRPLELQKDIAVVLRAGGGLPPVMMDRFRVNEVLDNLLSNALKYTYPGGRVEVYSEVSEEWVSVHVSDTGQGLDEQDMQEVFRSFKRLSARPTASEPSTGLGLAIIRKVVEQHGGRVWVESRKGEGAKFSFALPRHEHKQHAFAG